MIFGTFSVQVNVTHRILDIFYLKFDPFTQNCVSCSVSFLIMWMSCFTEVNFFSLNAPRPLSDLKGQLSPWSYQTGEVLKWAKLCFIAVSNKKLTSVASLCCLTEIFTHYLSILNSPKTHPVLNHSVFIINLWSGPSNVLREKLPSLIMLSLINSCFHIILKDTLESNLDPRGCIRLDLRNPSKAVRHVWYLQPWCLSVVCIY